MKDDYYYLNFKEQEGMDVSWAFSGIPTEVRQEYSQNQEKDEGRLLLFEL